MSAGGARSQVAAGLKIAIALAYALLPLSLALRVPEPVGADGWALATRIVAKTFFLVSIAIFTFEILRLRRFPSTSNAIVRLAAILVAPGLWVAAHALVFSTPVDRMLREMAAFYLAQFVGVLVVLAIVRFAVQRTVRGWEWLPTAAALVCLFGPVVVALAVFMRTLWPANAPVNGSAVATLAVGLIATVASEVRWILRFDASSAPEL